MNGRTVRKILMRGRVRTFYGARALFVVRVPLSKIPEPVPAFKPLGESTGIEGHWEQENEDGTQTFYQISELHSAYYPKDRKWPNGFVPDIHHVEHDRSEYDEDERWSWYEGTETLRDRGDPYKILFQKNLPAEVVDAYVAKRRWFKKYVFGSKPTGIEWLDEFRQTATFAKRYQPILRGSKGTLDLAYFVRWHQPRMKLWFCSQMRRALKAAKKAKVTVRVLRPPRR